MSQYPTLEKRTATRLLPARCLSSLMSVLFGRVEPVPVSVALNDELERNIEIGRDLWDGEERVAVALSARRRVWRNKVESSLETRLCWAILNEELPPTEIRVPTRWIQSYPYIFSSPFSPKPNQTHQITPVRPVVLSEIILSALSSSAYELSRTAPNTVEDWFCASENFIHDKAVYEFTLPPSSNGNGAVNGHAEQEFRNGATDSPFKFSYKVIMTSPVLQGIPRRGDTRFHVVEGRYSSDFDNVADSSSIPQRLSQSSNSSEDFDSSDRLSEEEEEDSERLEIDEGFLANSISGLQIPNINGNGIEFHDAEEWRDFSSSDSSTIGQTPPLSIPSTPPQESHYQEESSHGIVFNALPLTFPFEVDDLGKECQVFVRTADLGKVGVFNGDWAFISTLTKDSSDPTSSRLVRIYANDDLLTPYAPHTLLSSPLTLSSLSLSLSTSSPAPHIKIKITPSPFASHAPPLPTSTSITLARIASPYSVDRIWERAFLRGLKLYFEGESGKGRRVVRKGDLICVGISEVDSRINVNVEGGIDILDYSLPLSSNTPQRTIPIFFKVTSLDHPILDTTSSTNSSMSDPYVGVTMGEYGCYVDPKKTRIVQVGVEHSRVPDVSGWMGLALTFKPFTPNADTPYQKLHHLIAASLLPSSSDYNLQLSILLKGARGVGKKSVIANVARRLGVHVLEINCYDILGENDIKTEGTLRARFEKAASCSPCIFHLRYLDALAQRGQVLETGREPHVVNVLRECMNDLQNGWKLTGWPVIVVASTSDADRIPLGVLGCFKHDITFEAPNETERLGIIENLLQGIPVAADVSVEYIARQTAALVAADLVDLVDRARSASLERTILECSTTSPGITESDLFQSGIPLTSADIESALSKARTSYSESIGAPKIPTVSWDDVGGLAKVKEDILDTIQLPLEHPELFADGLKKRSGILLYGPPGTGKTLLAKAVATSCSLNFFSVKGPELLNMYIGESEANVRRVFQRARDAKPCVIFFDELDSVAPKRGNHGDSGGVMDRIVSQLLAELDGMAEGTGSADVFVIGATNRPDLLDSALLRPGRFDRMLYLGVSDTHEAQLKILHALTRKFRLAPDLDLRDIAEQCPFNYTGADFYALCSDAMLKSMSRKAEDIEAKIAELNRSPSTLPDHPHPLTAQYYLAELATPEETDIIVSQKDFEEALAELVPSVSRSEMEHYAAVQKRFANETINAIKEEEEGGSSQLFGESVITEQLVSRPDKGKGKERAID